MQTHHGHGRPLLRLRVKLHQSACNTLYMTLHSWLPLRGFTRNLQAVCVCRRCDMQAIAEAHARAQAVSGSCARGPSCATVDQRRAQHDALHWHASANAPLLLPRPLLPCTFAALPTLRNSEREPRYVRPQLHGPKGTFRLAGIGAVRNTCARRTYSAVNRSAYAAVAIMP